MAQLAGEAGRLPEGRQRIERTAGPVRGVPELEQDLPTLRHIRDAELQRGLQPRGRLVESERGAGGAGGEDVVPDAACGSSIGAATVKWCARSASRRADRPPERSSASPTRRWSSARRIRLKPSYSARRSSSCANR